MKLPRLALAILAFFLAYSFPSSLPGAQTKKAAKPAPAKKGRQKRPVVYRAPVQSAPSPDRVKEIQQALADRGFQTPVDGVWGKDSVTALAKFQEEQKIDGRGKLTALSLIALGLGPKKE